MTHYALTALVEVMSILSIPQDDGEFSSEEEAYWLSDAREEIGLGLVTGLTSYSQTLTPLQHLGEVLVRLSTF